MSVQARNLLKGLFQGLAILALTLVLTETVFRVINHFRPIYIFPGHDYNLLRAKPNTPVRGTPTNALGFRDEEIEMPKPSERRRVLVMGDSFVFGVVPYEHLFTHLLEEELDFALGDVDVVNMGIPRTSVNDYYALLVNEGLRVRPDVLVLCFYIGNDFNVWDDPAKRPSSYVWALLRYFFYVLPNYEGNEYGKWEYEDKEPSMKRQAYLKLLAGKLKLFEREEPSFEPAFDWVSEYLLRTIAVTRKWDIEPLVVLIPDEIQVDRRVRKDALQTLQKNHRRYDFELPNARLTEVLEGNGVQVLDLLPILREESRKRRVYKPRDTHWNIHGNEIVSAEIAKVLSQSVKLAPVADR